MKKALLYLVFLTLPVFLFAQVGNVKKAGEAIPDQLVGHWQTGTFSLTTFWNPATGQYVGNAGEASRSYRIAKDGTAEEFFIYNATSYNCRTEILGYRRGTININRTEKSFAFFATSGNYRTANCFKKDWTKKEYGEKDLYSQYQFTGYWEIQDGNLVIKQSPDAETSTVYKKIGTAD